MGARTNREGGPSALAAALTGVTPDYGYHRDENRQPDVVVLVEASATENDQFGALGKAIGERPRSGGFNVPYIIGVEGSSVENLKSFCASLATYGGLALFHMPGITPGAAAMKQPGEESIISQSDLEAALRSMNDDIQASK